MPHNDFRAFAYGIAYRHGALDWLLVRDPGRAWRLPGREITTSPTATIREAVHADTGQHPARTPELRAHQWVQDPHGRPRAVYLFFLGCHEPAPTTTGPELTWKHHLVVPHYLPRTLSSLVITLQHRDLITGIDTVVYQEASV